MINTTYIYSEDFRITKKLYDICYKYFCIPADHRIKLRYYNHFKQDL